MANIKKAPAGLEELTVTELPEVGDVVRTVTKEEGVLPPPVIDVPLDPKNPLPYFQARDSKVVAVREVVPGTYETFYG